MKKFGMLTLSAILGSTLTIGLLSVAGWGNARETVKVEHVSKPLAHGAVLTIDDEGEIVPLDFRATAQDAMHAVVHIKSTHTLQGRGTAMQGRNQLPDPFRQFFGDDFFLDFFGHRPRFHQRAPGGSAPRVNVGTGSGVIVNSEGYIVTNNHVIAEADDLEVTLHDNRTFKAEIVGTDPSTDLALIRIEATDLPTIPMVNSDEVEVGEWVLAVGNPFNLNSTVTAGIVSAKARNINILRDQGAIESFIQTDAAINPGNSGGALVNLQGGLVGINTAIASPTGAYTGYGFAVPSNMVNKVVDDLLRYGIVQRGYLGVMIRGVDGNLAREKGLEVARGVYVDSLLENSAAALAGIEAGDVILRISGQEVYSVPQLQELVGRGRPGDELEVELDRFGERMTLQVTLHNRDGETAVIERASDAVLDQLGADFETLDAATAEQQAVEGGVRVTEMRAGKLRRHTDIREGFIITHVDNRAVTSVEAFRKALKGKRGGIVIEGIYPNYPGKYFYAIGM